MKRVYSDQPARSFKEDLLGRAPFGERIAQSIAEWQEEVSFVVAVCGSWGSGKSSIKNFCIEALREKHPEVDVVQLDVWQLSGHRDIESSFFGSIGGLFEQDPSEASRKVAKRWRLFSTATRLGSAVVNPLAAAIASALGDPTLAAPLSAAATGVSGVTSAGSELLDEREVQLPSVDQSKHDLAKALRERCRTTLVVIDDLDRLTPDEIRLIFRLVKANGDLPTIVYLLLFDEQAVLSALRNLEHELARDYLEKIVQVRLEVPYLEPQRLLDVLGKNLSEVFDRLPSATELEQPRFIDLYLQHLFRFFRSLRDVYRVLAGFDFHTRAFTSGESIEVNLVDLLALEVLRQFEPTVYNALPEARTLLLGGIRTGRDAARAEEEKAQIRALVELSSERNRDAVTATMRELFPRISWAFGGAGHGEGFDLSWAREKRVCTDVHFDKYFLLGLSKGEVSQTELDALVQASDNSAKLSAFFNSIKESGRYERLLTRLEIEIYRVPAENSGPFVRALFDSSEDLPTARDFWSLGSDHQVVRIAFRLLRKDSDGARAEQTLFDVIRESGALYLPTKIVLLDERDADGRNATSEFIISEDRYKEFTDECVKKIQASAADGSLLIHPRLLWLLFRWLEWAGAMKVRRWARKQLREEGTTLALLKGFVQVSRESGFGTVVTREVPYIQLKTLEQFVSLSELQEAVAKINRENLGEWDTSAIRAYEEALRRRELGKSEDRPPSSFGDDSEE